MTSTQVALAKALDMKIKGKQFRIEKKKRSTCGKCAWQRRLVCRNPSSERVDEHVSTSSSGCGKFREIER